MLSVAVACAVCNALALMLLVKLQRSLRVVKRPSKLPAKRLEDDLCNFEAKLLRPLPQEGLDELARQLSGCAKGSLYLHMRLLLTRAPLRYWHKDNDASDSMDGPLNVIQAPWLLRQAVHFIVGLELKLIGGDFHFIVCSRIQWFKIREVFAIGGEGRRFQRRDLRGGGATGRCAITAEGVWLAVEWGDPFGAHPHVLIVFYWRAYSLCLRAQLAENGHISFSRTEEARSQLVRASFCETSRGWTIRRFTENASESLINGGHGFQALRASLPDFRRVAPYV